MLALMRENPDYVACKQQRCCTFVQADQGLFNSLSGKVSSQGYSMQNFNILNLWIYFVILTFSLMPNLLKLT